MIAVIYARYSSARQRDESIEDQLKACHTYAKREGYTVMAEYCDHALSGTTDARPEFQRMVADAQHKRFEAVIVYKLDRFARNRYDSSIYKHALKLCGVRVVSATEGIPDTAEGIILESLMEGMAEWYSANLAQNVKRGLMGNAEKCKANGVPIFGYRIVGGYYEPDPVAAPLVAELFSRRAAGESQLSLARWLNAQGARTYRGNEWTATKIDYILKNDKYTGLYHFSGLYKDGGMPALVDKDTFYKVSGMKARRKNMTADLALRGKAFCGCGRRMIGTAGTSGTGTVYHYYSCPNCKAERVSANKLEDFVLDKAVRLLCDEQAVSDVMDAIERYTAEREPDNAAYVKALTAKKRDCDRRVKNLMRAVEASGHSDMMLGRIAELEKESADVASAIAREKAAAEPLERDVMEFFIARMRDKAIDEDDGRGVLDAFVHRVFVKKEEIAIEYNFRQKSENTPFMQVFSVDSTVRGKTVWSG